MGVTSQNNTIGTEKSWEVKLKGTAAWIFGHKLKLTLAFHLTMANSVIVCTGIIIRFPLITFYLHWNTPPPHKKNCSNYNLCWLMT